MFLTVCCIVSRFQPSWTSHRGSILFRIEGDPLTPDLPSIDNFYKLSYDQADLPTIPTLPISYADAEQLMKYVFCVKFKKN